MNAAITAQLKSVAAIAGHSVLGLTAGLCSFLSCLLSLNYLVPRPYSLPIICFRVLVCYFHRYFGLGLFFGWQLPRRQRAQSRAILYQVRPWPSLHYLFPAINRLFALSQVDVYSGVIYRVLKWRDRHVLSALVGHLVYL